MWLSSCDSADTNSTAAVIYSSVYHTSQLDTRRHATCNCATRWPWGSLQFWKEGRKIQNNGRENHPKYSINFIKDEQLPSDSEGKESCVLLSVSDVPGLLVWNIYLHI